MVARADVGRLSQRAQRVEMAALLEEIRATTAIPTHVTVTISMPPGTATIGDPADLTRLFRNVLDSAVRHARNTATVTAGTSTGPRGTVHIAIADDGPGVPQEERDRIFDRFVRLDASRTGGATGLGLATAHRGAIRSVEPQTLPGALFVVTLQAATGH